MGIRNGAFKIKFALVVFTVFLFLSGCQNKLRCEDQIGCIRFEPGEPLTFGIERATTGDESYISQSIIDALKFANSQQPKFLGHPIQFFIQDTPCTLHDHIFTTGTLVSQPDLIAVIGPVCQSGSIAYAKIISDAGLPLLSPAGEIDSLNLHGVYGLYPSTQALAAELDSLLAKSSKIKNIDLVIWDRTVDIQFSNEFCELWQGHGYKCNRILQLRPDDLDISDIPNQIIGQYNTLFFILPFSYMGQIPDFQDVLKNRMVAFFDPELGVWDKNQDPYSQNRLVITYHWRQDIVSTGIFPSSDLPEIRSLFAYDAYNMLFKSLSETAEVSPDGKMVIFRHALQHSIEKIVDYNGLAGIYSCANSNSCLKMDGFLELRTPIQ